MLTKKIRIFISSPGDVNEERDKAKRVIAALQRQYQNVELEPVLWEELPLAASNAFQSAIDRILEEKPIDIAVFILWARLGSPLSKKIVTKEDGSEYRSGTEREFDLMLEMFEKSGCKQPIILAYTRTDDQGFVDRFRSESPDRYRELIEQHDLAKSFIEQRFHDADGRNLRAYHSYPEPKSFADLLRTHLRGALNDLVDLDNQPRWEESPFRSLDVFEVEHAPIFFGRDKEIFEVMQRLRQQEAKNNAFVVIVGASGSGKSSLAMAGVAATLKENLFDAEVNQWRIARLTPSLGEHGLLTNLLSTIATQLPNLIDAESSLVQLAEDLADSPHQFVRHVIQREIAVESKSVGGPVKLLIVLDQLEELWTDRDISGRHRNDFFAAIEALCKSGAVSVLATLRSDFYSHAQQIPTFLELKDAFGQYDLLPPDAGSLQQLIVEPARLAGLQFDQDESTNRKLNEVLLQEAVLDPSALPLIEYTLDELYEQRDQESRKLRLATYDAMGGIEGAIASRAAAFFDPLSESAKRALPEILPLLVSVDIAGEQSAVRRRADLAELTATPARKELVDQLVRARFLTTDQRGLEPVASFAHEALLRRWSRVADWISDNRNNLQIRARIEQSHARWEDSCRDTSLLLPEGLPLEEGRQIFSCKDINLPPLLANYIKLSEQLSDDRVKEEMRRKTEAAAALFANGLTEYANHRMYSGIHKLVSAWSLLEESDPIKGGYARVIADRLTSGGRLRVSMRQDAESSVVFSPDGALVATQAAHEVSLWNVQTGLPVGGRIRHEGEIHAVAFSPDSTQLASASSDSTARLWDVKTGLPTGLPLRHEESVNSVVFSPDGTRIATASDDNSARLWDADTGLSVGEPMWHEEYVDSVEFSPDGSLLATYTSFDNTSVANVWDIKTGLRADCYLWHSAATHPVVFSSDGKRLVTASCDGLAQLWDTTTGLPVGAPMQHDADIASVTFSSDSTRVATVSKSNTVRLWDANTGLPISEPIRDECSEFIAFSPDCRHYAEWNFDDGTVILIDARTGLLVGKAIGHEAGVISVAFSPDGMLLATASNDKTIRLWDAVIAQPIGEPMLCEMPADRLTFSPNGRHLAAQSWSAEKAHLWNIEEGMPVGVSMRHADRVYSVAFNPNGSQLVTGSYDDIARLWDTKTGLPTGIQIQHQSLFDTSVHLMAFSPEGMLVAAISDDKTVRLWDAKTGLPVGELMRHVDEVDSVAFSPDGLRLVTASFDNYARLWDVKTFLTVGEPMLHGPRVPSVKFSPNGTQLASFVDGEDTLFFWDAITGLPIDGSIHHEGGISEVQFSPDGTRVATLGYENDPVRLWDSETGDPIGEPIYHKKPIVSVAFSPCGTKLATSANDHFAQLGFARLWDANTGLPSSESMWHRGKVTAVVFSPDGTQLATASDDKTAQLWDSATGLPVGVPMRHDAEVISVVFSPDGTLLATASEDNTVRLWKIPMTPTEEASRRLIEQVVSETNL